MGLDINCVQFLLAARKRGAGFDEILTLGRLVMNVYPAKMVKVLESAGLPAEPYLQAVKDNTFAEPFFASIGAKTIDSLDASKYEGASVVQDLNQPVPDALKGRFDAIFDGGTLEHVFNIPAALKNCMEMTKVGGRFYMHTCANNLCGHGFYQFSPELFYRVFSEQNGFEVERMVIHPLGPYGQWYEVSDPNKIHERVELITFRPMQLLVQARRVKAVPIFATATMQSDYQEYWWKQKGQDKPATPEPSWLKKNLPGVARTLHVAKLGVEFYRRQSLGNRRFFKPVNRTD